jgi:hypothetical protein
LNFILKVAKVLCVLRVFARKYLLVLPTKSGETFFSLTWAKSVYAQEALFFRPEVPLLIPRSTAVEQPEAESGVVTLLDYSLCDDHGEFW